MDGTDSAELGTPTLMRMARGVYAPVDSSPTACRRYR